MIISPVLDAFEWHFKIKFPPVAAPFESEIFTKLNLSSYENRKVETLLVGGWPIPLWKMMEFVNGKDYPIYEMENKTFQTTNQINIHKHP